MKFTELSLTDLKETDYCCYVISNIKGNYNIHIRDENGESKLIPVYQTFIPQDICVKFSMREILKSSDFRSAVNRKIISVIPEREAKVALDTPLGRREFERLQKEYDVIPTALRINKSESENIIPTVDPTESVSITDMDEISDKVRDIIIRDDLSNDDKLAMLIAEEKDGSITNGDLDYIIASAPSDASQVLQWAKKQRDGRRGLLSSD